MDNMTGLVVIGALVVFWVVQLLLTQQQLARFYKRLKELRKSGVVAVGKDGNRLTGRHYGVLCVDPETRIIVHAEKLVGATVFASLTPVPEIQNKPLQWLLTGKVQHTLKPRTLAAFLMAGREIETHLNQMGAVPVSKPETLSAQADSMDEGIPA
jgi:DNA-binding transcriptional regulator of glucitol operon